MTDHTRRPHLSRFGFFFAAPKPNGVGKCNGTNPSCQATNKDASVAILIVSLHLSLYSHALYSYGLYLWPHRHAVSLHLSRRVPEHGGAVVQGVFRKYHEGHPLYFIPLSIYSSIHPLDSVAG